jgi:hypothetical protein
MRLLLLYYSSPVMISIAVVTIPMMPPLHVSFVDIFVVGYVPLPFSVTTVSLVYKLMLAPLFLCYFCYCC